jgi:hypothetical protein
MTPARMLPKDNGNSGSCPATGTALGLRIERRIGSSRVHPSRLACTISSASNL